MASIKLLLAFLASFIGGAKLPIPQTSPEYAASQNRQGVFQELTLTPTNVATSTFKKRYTLTLDGLQIYAQPVFVQGVTIGAATYDLVIVATQNNSVYAFDANNLTQLWRVNFGANYVNYPGKGNPDDALYDQTVGCMSTPAVDQAKGVLFVVCAGSTGAWTLRELSIATGGTLLSTVVAGQVVGTGMSGDTIISGRLQFGASQHLQRNSLAIVNGVLYFGFASYGDTSPWHGWIFGYNELDLSQAAVMCTTPNGKYGGIWMSGNAFAVDSAGFLYTTTGNGDYDGSTNFANSVLKLNSSLSIVDWFTPSNWASLESADFDVTSGRVILLGDGNVISGGKDYREFMLNTQCMGRLQGSNSSCLNQIWSVPGSGHYGIFGGVFFNGTAFLPVNSGPVYAYPYSAGTFNTSSPVTTSASFGHPGARMAVSANGTQNAILWAITCVNPANATAQPGILHAFNPVTLAEIYNSTTSGTDTLGTLAKLGSPLIVSGRVWVPTGDGTVVVYGLN